MKFKHLHLENFRSYRILDIAFCDGVTVISGANGSGKSSILEGCFMALFGAAALSGTGLQIADMVFKGESKATSVLDFEHMGKSYRIEQQFRVSKGGSGSNFASVLSQDGVILSDQTRKTYTLVCEILNMDEKAYQNCAYIRQGEIDDLINAKPKERQKMIDDLLRLGKLEEYRERAALCKTSCARLARVETEKRNDTESKIDVLRKKDILSQIEVCQKLLNRIDNIVASFSQKKDEFSERRIRISEKIKSFKEDEQELQQTQESLKILIENRTKESERLNQTLQSLVQAEKKYCEFEAYQKEELIKVCDLIQEEDSSDFISWVKSSGLSESLSSLLKDASDLVALTDSNVTDVDPGKIVYVSRRRESFYRDWMHAAGELKMAATAQHKSRLEEKERLKNQKEHRFQSVNDVRKDIEKLNESLLDLHKQIEQNGLFIQNKRNDYKKILSLIVPDASFLFLIDRNLPVLEDLNEWKKWLTNFEEMDRFTSASLQSDQNEIKEVEVKRASLKSELDEKTKAIDEIDKTIRSYADKSERALLEKSTHQLRLSETNKKISGEYVKIQDRKAKINQLEKDLGVSILSSDAAESLFSDLHEHHAEVEKEIASLTSQKSLLQKSLIEFNDIIKAGKCPTCGQNVDPSHIFQCSGKDAEALSEIEEKFSELESSRMRILDDIEKIKKIRLLFHEIVHLSAGYENLKTEKSGISAIIDKLSNDIDESRDMASRLTSAKTSNEVLIQTTNDALNRTESEISALKVRYQERFKLSAQLSDLKKSIVMAVSDLLQLVPQKNSQLNLKAEKQNQEDELIRLIKEDEALIKSVSSLLKEDESRVEKHILSERNISSLFSEKSEISRRAENLAEVMRSSALLKAEMDAFEKSKHHLSESISEKDREILEKKQKKESLIQKTQNHESLEEYVLSEKKLLGDVDVLNSKIKELTLKRSDLQQKYGLLQGEQIQLQNYIKDLAILKNKSLYIDLVLEDLTALEAMYLRIRAEMRSKNIEALDTLLNEMFSFIYINNAYSHIELDVEYNLKVFEKNGVFLEPKLLSGGERALFNLALRCAIYRLLSYGFGEYGAKGNVLPPMILDEPTVFLDSGHIRQLIKLIDLMKNRGVGQIIVVSHDESLIDSADRVYNVCKDSVTNTSHFTEFSNMQIT